MKLPALGTTFETIKQGSISLIAAFGAMFGVYTCYDALTGDLVIVDTIRVPPGFESLGYTGEIATQRLLDEVARINSLATLAKERKRYGDTALFNSIAQTDATTIAGIDVKSIRSALQKAVGREPMRISGEIALIKRDGKDAYTVRLRSNPPRRLLVDIAVDGEPGLVLEKTAMAMLEQLDPAIAVSVYRLWNDVPNALRMVDAALANDDPSDDVTAVQQRSFVYAQMGRFAEAEADAKTASGFGRHTALTNLYREMDRYEEALAEADSAIKASPQNPQGYYLKGRVQLRMKKASDAVETFRKTASMFPSYWPNHYWMAIALTELNDFEGARVAYGKTIVLAPQQIQAHFNLAEVETKLGHPDAALALYRKAYSLAPTNPLYMIGALEAESQRGNEDRAASLRAHLADAMKDRQFPDRLRRRAEAAMKTTATASAASPP